MLVDLFLLQRPNSPSLQVLFCLHLYTPLKTVGMVDIYRKFKGPCCSDGVSGKEGHAGLTKLHVKVCSETLAHPPVLFRAHRAWKQHNR